jgi:hypothetical protein
MSEFTNITLLECSRNQSNQQESNDNKNYSLWTNRLGRTIQLDIGDTIEIKSAYINQRGCASPDSIEFKGRDLGVDIELEETISQSPDVYVDDQLPFPNLTADDNIPAQNNYQMGGVGFRYIKNEAVKKRLKDNVLYLEENFYKNANGEETIMLPRSYNRVRVEDVDGTAYPEIGTKVSRYWTLDDVDYDYGTVAAGGYVPGINSGVPLLRPQNRLITANNSPNDEAVAKLFNTHDWEVKLLEGFSDDTKPTNPLYLAWRIKQRNDNSRFTLFEREFDFMIWSAYEVNEDTTAENDTYNPKFEILDANGNVSYNLSSKKWFENNGNIPAYAGNQNTNFPPGYRRIINQQPALYRYTKVSDVIEVKLKTGFNSPQSVANQITQQLQEQKKDSPIYYGKQVDVDGMRIFRENRSVAIETPTFKPVLCSNYRDLNNLYLHDGADDPINNFQSYMSSTENQAISNSAFEWWRAHHNIYVKRPDLFIAGRKVNTRDGYVYNPIDGSDSPGKDRDLYGGGRLNFIQNPIAVENLGTLDNNSTSPIITSWIWNDENLNALKELFDIQGQYPELFSGIDNTIGSTTYLRNVKLDGNNTDYTEPATIENSRFLHVNRFNYVADHFETLGDDDYNQIRYTDTRDGIEYVYQDITHMTMPVFFAYQRKNKDVKTSGEDINDMCYGFATKSRATYFGGGDATEREYITIHPELLNGLRPELFNNRGGLSETGVWQPLNIDEHTTLIGWDWHWNSYGNLCLLKDSGIPEFDQGSGSSGGGAVEHIGDISFLRLNKDIATGTGGHTTNIETIKHMNLSYIGTNNIACKYNEVDKNFYWEYLHTPERINNNWNSGIPEGSGATATSVAIVDGQGTEVYKINKRLYGWTFCPDMTPYLNNDKFRLGSGGTDPQIQINSFSGLIPWRIYDSHMGVNLNFGKSAKLSTEASYTTNISQDELWNNSVLGIMGFSYEQFNPKEIVFTENGAQARVRYDNANSLYNPTTNCQVVNVDTNQFVVSPWGAVQYGTQLPYSMLLNQIEYTRFGYAQNTHSCNNQYLPAITQNTQSIQITSVNLPRVVLKPFYSIRTDILSQDRYVGGLNSGLAYPIIASINRINADKDFVQLDGGSEVFTITTPLKFSSITTAITDADGQLSELDDGSVVIYKITKMDNLENYDVLAQIQQKLSSSKKKK